MATLWPLRPRPGSWRMQAVQTSIYSSQQTPQTERSIPHQRHFNLKTVCYYQCLCLWFRVVTRAGICTPSRLNMSQENKQDRPGLQSQAGTASTEYIFPASCPFSLYLSCVSNITPYVMLQSTPYVSLNITHGAQGLDCHCMRHNKNLTANPCVDQQRRILLHEMTESSTTILSA